MIIFQLHLDEQPSHFKFLLDGHVHITEVKMEIWAFHF